MLSLVILIPLACLVTLFGAYLLLLTIASAFHRAPEPKQDAAIAFAVVIPAHNEEEGIGATVASVLRAAYPRRLFEVFVIADNCEDATADRAADAGVSVFERTDPVNHGKGQAIEWFLSHHEASLAVFDAIVFLDADNEMDPVSLSALASAFSEPGVCLVQGYDGVSNPGAHWRAALTFAGFATVNHLRPAGQDVLGAGPVLKGCGMAFDRELLLNYGWPAHSVVEDMELSLRLALDGHRVHYHPGARVLSAMPSEGAQAVSQRRRWEGGRAQLARSYAPRFLQAFVKRPRWRYLCLALEVLTPPLSFLASLEVLFLVLSIVFWRPAFIALALANVAVTGAYVAAALWQVRAPASVWRALAAAPLFVLWKLPIYVKVLLRGADARWIRTARKPGRERSDSSRHTREGER